jgi:type I restriction enzyme, S subunit
MTTEKTNTTKSILYDLALWQNGAAFKNSDFSDRGLPIIKIGELNRGISGETKYTDKSFDEKYRINNEDILFSWSGNPDTSINIYKYSFGEAWLNQHIWKVSKTEETLDSKYFFYLLESLLPKFIHIAKNKQTTGLGHVTIKDLKNIEVEFPDLNKQKAVAEILSSIDDKIELNRKMNDVLEEMGQTLFRHWFVDFEFPWDFVKNEFSWDGKPYKSSGGEMVESDLGEIPKGWEVVNMNDAFDFKGGAQPPKSTHIYEKKPGYIRFIQNRDYASIKNLTYIPDSTRNKICNEFDILMDKYGEVGKIRHGIAGSYNVALAKIVPMRENLNEYLRGFFSQSNIQRMIESGATASTRGSLNRLVFHGKKMFIPNDSILKIYEHLGNTWIEQDLLIKEENSYLVKTRDLLLPRLMSGKLRVPIEK